MRIHVAIATTGRPDVLCKVVDRFRHQTRPADGIVVVGAAPEDIAGLDRLAQPPQQAVVSPKKGLCAQRNVALSLLRGQSDAVVFFDDDFLVAHDFLQRLWRSPIKYLLPKVAVHQLISVQQVYFDYLHLKEIQ